MLFNLQPLIYRYNNRSSFELNERDIAGSSNVVADHSQSSSDGKDEESNEMLSGQIEEEEDDLSNGEAEADYNNENDARVNSSTDNQR